MSGFDTFARWYDGFSDLGYYDDYARFIHRAVSAQSDITVTDILDLGCGTGLLSSRLEKSGYSVIGIDDSAEMLSRARMASETLLLTQQSITDFELYGTVQAVVCTQDTLNYLPVKEQLSCCFSLVANYLEPGGLFIFDVNTEYRFSFVYGDRDFVYESGGDMFVWRNRDRVRSHIMELTLFKRERGGYSRYDETQVQYKRASSFWEKLLKDNGFIICGVYSDLNGAPKSDTAEKNYYVAKRNV